MIASAFAILSALSTVALAVPARRSPPAGHIATSNNPRLCVIPKGNSVGNGIPVQLAACADTNSTWTFGTGSLRIFDKCLDIVNGANTNGTRLQTWECTGGPNQQFVLNDNTIQWAGKGKCLDVTNGAFVPGTPLQVWDCTSGRNQIFTFPANISTPRPRAPKFTLFKPTAHPNFCMDVNRAANANGTALQIYTCNGTPAQNFYPAAGGWHILGNKAIDLTNGLQTDGNKLQIWTSFPGSKNQQWTYDATNKALRLTSNPKKCIDITNGAFVDGTRLQVWDCTFRPNQQFSAVALAA